MGSQCELGFTGFCIVGEISPLGDKKKGGGVVIATCTKVFFLENPKNSPKVVMFSREKKGLK
jgi:hypothetical protein